jgi:hypothetical protein
MVEILGDFGLNASEQKTPILLSEPLKRSSILTTYQRIF